MSYAWSRGSYVLDVGPWVKEQKSKAWTNFYKFRPVGSNAKRSNDSPIRAKRVMQHFGPVHSGPSLYSRVLKHREANQRRYANGTLGARGIFTLRPNIREGMFVSSVALCGGRILIYGALGPQSSSRSVRPPAQTPIRALTPTSRTRTTILQSSPRRVREARRLAPIRLARARVIQPNLVLALVLVPARAQVPVPEPGLELELALALVTATTKVANLVAVIQPREMQAQCQRFSACWPQFS